MTDPAAEIARRRTFAIISHPDAGKTTLTEQLLRAGGAIQLAGNVRAKGERRRTRSDWMGIERERGISVVTSVMTFEHAGCVFNLLDTPGHEDFSEDTYRTLTAVDSAVMVIDAAKGIEARTRKLFEICRLRDIPIVTFINKMDRESRDPFELLDEVASTLALDTAPVTWPVGRAADFAGTYDLRGARSCTLTQRSAAVRSAAAGARRRDRPGARRAAGIRSRGVQRRPPDAGVFRQRHQGHRRRRSAGRAGRIRPAAARAAGRHAHGRGDRAGLTALVFKIQANMDPNHRDRIAFARVCSGRLVRGMRLKQVRTGKLIPLHAPQFFFAREREIADEAFAGDVVGIPNHGTLRIGDTLTDGEDMNFVGVPYFAPEILRRVRLDDAMKAKKLRQALQRTGGGRRGAVVPPAGRRGAAGRRGRHACSSTCCRRGWPRNTASRSASSTPPYALARWVSSDDRAALAEVHRRQPQRDGRRCGWRSGVPRHLGVHDAPRRGAARRRWRSATSRTCGRRRWRRNTSPAANAGIKQRHGRHWAPAMMVSGWACML